MSEHHGAHAARGLDRHRTAVAQALADAGLSWSAWPAVALTDAITPQVRLSALLVLIAEDRGPGSTVGVVALNRLNAIDRLRRYRLDWSAHDVRLALHLARDGRQFDATIAGVALRGAQRIIDVGRTDAALLDALDAWAAWLDSVDDDRWRIGDMRSLAARLIARTAPGELLDLSLVVDGDGWGGPAREVARSIQASAIAPLIRVLGQLGTGRPTRSWRQEVRSALGHQDARELLEQWLQLAAYAEPSEPDRSAADSAGLMLFSRSNELLVRAAVRATEELPTAGWVPSCLGVLARRGAATSGVPTMTAPLSLLVASAAVDALIARGQPADRAILEELFDDLSRRDLLKRVGQALGRDHETAERDDQLRKVKAANVRRKADPGPASARTEVDKVLREHVAPVLRGLGFRASGRTWRRRHADRTDVVALSSSADGLHLAYGTRFDAAHPPGEPYPLGGAVRDHHLDVRLFETWPLTEHGLAACRAHLTAVIDPFLDTLGHYELARAFLEQDAGRPAPADRESSAGSVAVIEVVGLLALAAGDRRTAVDRLGQCLTWAESHVTDERTVAFWREAADRARDLPSEGCG